jgi:hypothetical protein
VAVEPRRRDSYRTPDGVSFRTLKFGRTRWTIVFLLVLAFICAILLFGGPQR